MTTLRIVSAIALAGLALWAQAPQGGEGRGKGKGAATDGKGGRGGRGAAEAKALAPPPDPQVLRLARPDLFLVTGEGGNSIFRATPDGVILVDTKLDKPGNQERLTELVRGVTRQPQVKVVVHTHGHPDHTGNSARFQTAGAEIVTTDRTVRLGGVEARVISLPSGHTGNDRIVYFPSDGVVAIGDVVAANRAPAIDYGSGGSLTGWVQALDAVLALQWDVAIPGHGDPVNRAFVETYRNKLRTLIERGREAVARGVAKEQLLAQIKTDDLGWQFQVNAASLDLFVAELSR